MHEAIVDALGQHHPYARHIDTFLSDLRNEGKATNTLTAYRKDLIAFAAHTDGEIGELDVEPVRAFLSEQAELAASTRARRRASVSAFCRWAYRHDLITANPVDKTNPVSVPKGLPRPAATRDVARLLNAICSRRPARTVPLDVIRDRVLFELVYVTGARISEACGVHVEDLDLRVDDEHVSLHGKGGKIRTALLDDRGFVALLRLYLNRAGYTTGPLFRASINGAGGPLTPSAARARLHTYCAAAQVTITPHQLRHTHAQELTDADVNPEVIRRRLGHSRLETTLIYAQAKDSMVDNEIRAARRRRDAARR